MYVHSYIPIVIVMYNLYKATLNQFVEAINISSTISASVNTSTMLTYEDRYGFIYANTAT